MQISENFTIREATRSSTAARLGIKNIPDQKALVNIVRTAISMQEVRSQLNNAPISPSSWFRCLEVNRAIGSKDTSDHISGRAVDFTAQGIVNREAFNIIMSSDIQYDQLILEFEDQDNGGWLHISFPEIGSRSENQNLIATRVNGKTIYTEVKK